MAPGRVMARRLAEEAGHRESAPGIRVPELFVEPRARAHRADA